MLSTKSQTRNQASQRHAAAGMTDRAAEEQAIDAMARREGLAGMSGPRLVLVDKALLLAGKSPRGGWSRDQLSILGVPWPPPKGWKARILRNRITITEGNAARFTQKGEPSAPTHRPTVSFGKNIPAVPLPSDPREIARLSREAQTFLAQHDKPSSKKLFVDRMRKERAARQTRVHRLR